jgi:hypothetical protein
MRERGDKIRFWPVDQWSVLRSGARRLIPLITCLVLLCSCGGSPAGTSPGPSAPSAPTTPVVAFPSRMRYVRTDAAALYWQWPNPYWMIYNPPTARFFVADPATSRVIALDAATEAAVGSMQVPGAFAIDDTPDHSTLYVGTQIGDIYQIDPVALTVTHRYLASQIGEGGFDAGTALVMADGSLALLPLAGGIPGIDGYQEFAIWNPVTNSISFYERGVCPPGMLGPCTVLPTGEIGAFVRTPDRTKVVAASIDDDCTVCEVTEATGAQKCAVGGGYIHDLAISPDGNWIIIPPVVFSAQTLAQVAQLSFAGACSSAGAFGGYVVSADSKTLYITSGNLYARTISAPVARSDGCLISLSRRTSWGKHITRDL